MNDLYEAVMILGRSVEDINQYGWMCGALGDRKDSPKCVNGILTVSAAISSANWHMIAPRYIYHAARDFPSMREPLRLASVALLETVPPKCREAVVNELNVWVSDPSKTTVGVGKKNLAALDRPRNEDDMEILGDLLAMINDIEIENDPILDEVWAAAWFEAAFDHLAKELPEPIPADPPLTVDQIIAGAPDRVTVS